MQDEQVWAFNLQSNMVTHGLWDVNAQPCLENQTDDPAINDDPVCSICLDVASDSEDFLTNCCFSKFHLDCLNIWKMVGLRTCPNCRSNI